MKTDLSSTLTAADGVPLAATSEAISQGSCGSGTLGLLLLTPWGTTDTAVTCWAVTQSTVCWGRGIPAGN